MQSSYVPLHSEFSLAALLASSPRAIGRKEVPKELREHLAASVNPRPATTALAVNTGSVWSGRIIVRNCIWKREGSEDDDDEDNGIGLLGVEVAFGTILGAGLKGSEGPLVFHRTYSVVAHERGLKRAREEHERAREEHEQSQS